MTTFIIFSENRPSRSQTTLVLQSSALVRTNTEKPYRGTNIPPGIIGMATVWISFVLWTIQCM